jgi:transcriptional regulator with XRE-family HTH domain
MEARNELANEAITRAIGDESRRTREARGWSRAQFVKRLPSGIGDRTLLAYEHGLRQITALRLIELCQGLEVDAPAVPGRALQRAQLHIETLPLKVDLRALVKDYSPVYRPRAQWAKNTLNEHPGGIAEITPEVIKDLALFMGRDKAQLAGYLARFLAEDSIAGGDLR